MTTINTDDSARLESPVASGEAVDISSADHTPTSCTRALWVGTGGDVKVTLLSGSVVTLANVPDGTLLPVRALLVWNVGSTATDIVALW
jgi:hypothetical protein